MQVLIPAAGPGPDPGVIPPAFADVHGSPAIAHAIRTCLLAQPDARVAAVLDREQDRRFGLRAILAREAPGCAIALAGGPTCGALCTAMLAADLIDPSDSLVVVLADVFIAGGIADALAGFENSKAEAGVIVFPATGPRWSYARLDDRGHVAEVVEKSPISEFATAGVYWYRHAASFLRSAEAAIRNDRAFDGRFYIAPSLNEIVAAGGVVRHWLVERDRFHALSLPEDVARMAALLAPDADTLGDR
ncbi:MAG: sugar phosphate nucleotidyltransferase [Chloroflexota bacterium]